MIPGGVSGSPGHLADAEPQGRFLDISRRLVVAAEKADRGGGSGARRGRVNGSSVQGGHELEGGGSVRVGGEAGRVRGRAGDEEVVAEGVVGGELSGALFNGDSFGGRRVGDANVDLAGFKVLDGVGRITGDPGDGEGVGAVGDAIVDEGVGEC